MLIRDALKDAATASVRRLVRGPHRRLSTGAIRVPHVVDLTRPLQQSLEVDAARARRLLYIGPLTPVAGVMELAMAAAVVADRHPATAVELCWAGTGSLTSVLRAQPLPRNLTQRFLPVDPAATTDDLLADAGVLVVPRLAYGDATPVAEAMAAGFLLLASARVRALQALIKGNPVGWLYDPRRPGSLEAALEIALTTPPEQASLMRQAARARIVGLSAKATANASARGRWLPAIGAANKPA